MISTMNTFAPTGVPGLGCLDARAVTYGAEWPVARRLRALPAGAVAFEVFGIAPTGGRLDGTAVPTGAQFGTAHESNPQNDGTTLGIRSPGRPLS